MSNSPAAIRAHLTRTLAVLAVTALTALGAPAHASLFAIGNTSTGGAVGESNLYTIDPLTGAPTLIGATGFELRGLAIDPFTGRAYASETDRIGGTGGLFEVDLATGAATFIGGTQHFAKMAFDGSGALIAFESRTDSAASYDLLTVDVGTGLGTNLSSYNDSGEDCCFGFAYFSATDTFYFTPRESDFSNRSALETIDPATGARTTIGDTGIQYINALAASDSGVLYGALRSSSSVLYTIDTATGAATTVGSIGLGINAMSYLGSVPAPEPGTLALLALGIAGIGARRRRTIRTA